METTLVAADAEAAVARGLAMLRAKAGMDMAFGAKVSTDRRSMTITHVSGGLTRSLAGLVVTSGAGLGGKSLLSGRPARVHDYMAAEGITHVYDHAVAPEQLRTVAAVPVRVGASPRYVFYLGHRTPVQLGDRWLDALAPHLGEIERELSVQAEVQRRLAQAQANHPTTRPGSRAGTCTSAVPGHPGEVLAADEREEIAAELASLACEVGDETLRQRLAALQRRIALDAQPELARPRVSLTPRETAVLEQVAAGCSNAEAAERLGLLPNTVKSYLKSAMRKLDVHNRVQAIVAAREAGAIR